MAQKVGDWQQARRALAALPERLKAAQKIALLREAHLFRAEIVKGFTTQSPGGKPFKPLSETTLATRKFKGFRGTKALINRADLRNSVTAIVEGDTAFVGIKRTATGRDGRKLINIAQVHEFGARIAIAMSDKMRAFLHAMFREAGIPPRPGRGRSVIVIIIPPRPFLRPVWKKLAPTASKRYVANIDKLLKGTGVT